MSMNLESELRMYLKAMMCDMQSPNPFKSLDEMKAIIERYVQDLLDMLQESYEQVPELRKRESEGERESYESRYERLFSTPERTARTLAQSFNTCNNSRKRCKGCPFFDASACPNDENEDALLEWLRGDA